MPMYRLLSRNEHLFKVCNYASKVKPVFLCNLLQPIYLLQCHVESAELEFS